MEVNDAAPAGNRFADVSADTITNDEAETLLALGTEILERRLRALPNVFLHGESDSRDYVRSLVGREEREVFGGLFLTAQHRLIAAENLFAGSVDRSAVYPRVIVQRALHHNAAALVCFHNHPGGTSDPGMADERITARIKSVLDELDITLLDHIVATATETTSMAARGLV